MVGNLLKKRDRLQKARAALGGARLEGLIVYSPANITYTTGYDSRDSWLLLTQHEAVYFTDSRYAQEAERFLPEYFTIREIKGSALSSIAASCGSFGMRNVGFEEMYVSYAQHRRLKEDLNAGIELVPSRNIIEELRQIKDEAEIAKIREAVRITGKAYAFLTAFLKPGLTELGVAAEIERFVRYEGARGSSFAIIVAGGPNAAFPHHISSNRKLKTGEPVKIDMGVDYEGYKSDLTRVFFLGTMKPLVRTVYEIVRAAQENAIALIKPGVRMSELDAAARDHIARAGYAARFGHNLGHGVGLQVHEAPYLSAAADTTVVPGMVFTVEPGIYLPGKFGIRIEDMIVVTHSSCEVLSGSINK